MKILKKDDLKNIEKLKEKRYLSKEEKSKITARVVANWAICISIAILIMTFVIASELLEKRAAIFVYNVYSMVFLICSIVTLEVAYKKDSSSWAISGLEILFLAIFTLFAPYIFFRLDKKYIYLIIMLVTIYYIAKIIKITLSERKKYLLKISDISDIIKKESQDELAKDFQIEREEKIKKKEVKANKQTDNKEPKTEDVDKTAKRKTTTRKKSSTTKKTTTAKGVAKKASTENEKDKEKKSNTESKTKKVAKTSVESKTKTTTKKTTSQAKPKTQTKKSTARGTTKTSTTRKAKTPEAKTTKRSTAETKPKTTRKTTKKSQTEDNKTKKGE